MTRPNDPAPIPQLSTNHSVTNIMYWLWLSRTDLQQTYSLTDSHSQDIFITWFSNNSYNSRRSPINLYLQLLKSRFLPVYRLSPRSLRRHLKSLWFFCHLFVSNFVMFFYNKNHTLYESSEPINGANLIGWAKAELGMGEHVRMSAAALAAVGGTHGVLNYNVGISHSQRSGTQVQNYIDTNKYKVNIFHVNADQIWSLYYHLGLTFFENRYNIGYWAWELEKCPNDWRFSIEMMDEIWAPSTFIQACFQGATKKPVIHMPLCVELDAKPRPVRALYGLPESAFLFICIFDFYSYIHRKNPWASVRAFKAAFPNMNTDVRLVIKVMYGDNSSSEWISLLHLINKDPRIIIINNTMTRHQVLSLISSCDALVSLHRSEGFGRGPAEAMHMGKPVVVTNYSGNTDFTRADNSCLVNYNLIPVNSGQYPFGEGQLWAEADIDHASTYMRRLYDDSKYADQIGLAGQKTIRSEFNANIIGHRYVQRLQNLGFM